MRLHAEVLHHCADVVCAKCQADNTKLLANVHWLSNQALGPSDLALVLGEGDALADEQVGDVLGEHTVHTTKLVGIEGRLARGRHLQVEDGVVRLKHADHWVVRLNLHRNARSPLGHHRAGLVAFAVRRIVRLHLLDRGQPPQSQALVLNLWELGTEVGQGIREVIASEEVLHHAWHPYVLTGNALQPLHDLCGDEDPATERGAAPRLRPGDGDEGALRQQVADLLASVPTLAGIHHYESRRVGRFTASVLGKRLALVRLGSENSVHHHWLFCCLALGHHLRDDRRMINVIARRVAARVQSSHLEVVRDILLCELVRDELADRRDIGGVQPASGLGNATTDLVDRRNHHVHSSRLRVQRLGNHYGYKLNVGATGRGHNACPIGKLKESVERASHVLFLDQGKLLGACLHELWVPLLHALSGQRVERVACARGAHEVRRHTVRPHMVTVHLLAGHREGAIVTSTDEHLLSGRARHARLDGGGGELFVRGERICAGGGAVGPRKFILSGEHAVWARGGGDGLAKGGHRRGLPAVLLLLEAVLLEVVAQARYVRQPCASVLLAFPSSTTRPAATVPHIGELVQAWEVALEDVAVVVLLLRLRGVVREASSGAGHVLVRHP
mmetsp:Transcript_35148/g.59156  ORF Transcript_35148/g.59156 Transcript_35148/m.59156 type:complete len:617 (+) Transcript_35148:700-2550(+)